VVGTSCKQIETFSKTTITKPLKW